jgi:hypothetical protein
MKKTNTLIFLVRRSFCIGVGILSFIFLSVSIGSAQSLSPTVLASSGEYFSSGGITVSWTLGELAVETFDAGTVILTQGFQQPYDFETSIKETGLDWNITTYPNPVTDFLKIRFELHEPIDLNVEILDISGRKHFIQELYDITSGEIVSFNLSGFVRGVYLVRIYTPDQRVQKTYKIQKF